MIHTHTTSAVIYGSRFPFATAASSIVATTSLIRHQLPNTSRLSDEQTNSSRRAYATMATTSNRPDMRAKNANFAYFPLGYKEAAHQWWTSISPAAAERNVLAHIPYLRDALDTVTSATTTSSDPFGPRVWRSQMVQLPGKNRALNEFSVERIGEPVEDNLVILHGYGAGLGFFYKNFEPLSRPEGWKIYALDMLGMGNSSRPTFSVHAKDKDAKIAEAEAWFIDALEDWRKARNIDKFTLMGHSLGGYLSIAYALKYPGHLKKLILASPVGLPVDPYAVNEDLPEPAASTLENEFTQDQNTVVRDSHTKPTARAAASQKPPRRPTPGWFAWLWDANVSPFSIIRFTGPLGPRFVSGWTSRRFNHLPENESKSLHDYAFSIFRQRGSGEYALPYLLAPGAFARKPMVDRIDGVGRQTISKPDGTTLKETGIPVVLMYGENDWMDVAGGLDAEERLKQARVRALLANTDEEKRRENGSAKVIITPKAGHHLYLDNAEHYNAAILKEMAETREHGRKGLA
ncbi:abhydrolase domain-containing protein [Plectosphaerella plurivora]|uniref:Abhydrolase domain-containing protein n=1 Tax=Plectosphaerella plurivora TaxID=936078 RepID=A0A9P8VAZ2_9PEZI|nr:abhydrolase domain-containing protein [Plectosphaerella plurivora]